MRCKEIERLIMPYIETRLEDLELEQFLAHLEVCSACQDELETYYIVDAGLKQLDVDTGIYDIKGSLDQILNDSRQEVYYKKIRKIIYYAVNTLSIYSIVIMIFLQFRQWWR